MKSQTRAWLVFAVLLIFWGTLPVSPFKYFAEMIRDLGGLLAVHPFVPAAWQAIIIYVVAALVLSVLLLVGRSRNRLYLAGFCALAEMAYHLVHCIRTGKLYPVSLAIAIGLALALLFLLIKSKSPALWLSDAFTVSLAVWLIYDGLIYALEQLPGFSMSSLSGFMPVPADSLLARLNGFAGLPLAVWAILPALLAILPMIFLGRGRQKG